MTAKTLDSLLRDARGTKLAEIADKARSFDSLGDALRAAVDSELADGIIGASLRDDGELVVLCRSAAHASRLRFSADMLAEAAVAAGFPARDVRVRVSRDA